MPIMQEQNVFTQRIYHGDVEIKRVYLGDDLMWGLYNITYHLANGTQPSGVINEYVWGIADIDLPKPTWQGQSFFTKFNGWWEGNTYVTAVPAITKDLHEDLELYAKWTQRKYTYSGTYTYSEQVWVGGGGAGFDPYTLYGFGHYHDGWKTNTGLPENDEISAIGLAAYNGTLPNFNSAYGAGGGCTWWASGRSVMVGGKSWSGGGNAANWFGTFGGVSSGEASASDFEAGDLLDFSDGAGHVLFIEDISGDTMYVSESAAGSNNKWVLLMSPQSISRLISTKRHWFWGEPWLGILKNNVSGGGGHWETKTYNVNISETDSGINQKSPQRPSAPKGSWSQFNEYTYERNYHYDTNGSGEWREDWNQVATSWLPSSQSDGWY